MAQGTPEELEEIALKIQEWIKNDPQGPERVLKQSLQKAEETSKYLKEAQLIDPKILWEPMTI